MACKQCNVSFGRNKEFASCGICGNKYHYDCATKNNPDFSLAVLEVVKKSKGALIFRCCTCAKKPPGSDSALSEGLAEKLDQLDAFIRTELTAIRTELREYKENEKNMETTVKKLVVENNVLRRQLNRSDLIISGLPCTLPLNELYDEIIPKIGTVFNIDIHPYDINHCSWVRNKNAVLVKFNSVRKRDELLQMYLRNRSLDLRQLIDGSDIPKRIYINENLTPLAANLSFLCRKLIKEKQIVKYKLFNRNMPEARIVQIDGSERVVTSSQIRDLFKIVENAANATE